MRLAIITTGMGLALVASSPKPTIEPTAPAPVEAGVAVDSYACRSCGRVLYRADEVESTRSLWDLGEEKNEVHVLKSASGLDGLRRYDASLHEGWYCCRFALMRMIVDKFGTGDKLLAYASDTRLVPKGEVPNADGNVHPGQIRVGSSDFDAVVNADQGDHLTVVKFSATWCPPCRQIDSAIARIDAAGKLPDVRFYEADVDENPDFGDRFDLFSLPTVRFWYRGQPLEVRSSRWVGARGALAGAVSEQTLVEVSTEVLRAARLGQRSIIL